MGIKASKLAHQRAVQMYKDLVSNPPRQDGFMCDGCGMCPIQGIILYCSTCPDWHLCQTCMDTDPHDSSHELNWIRSEDLNELQEGMLTSGDQEGSLIPTAAQDGQPGTSLRRRRPSFFVRRKQRQQRLQQEQQKEQQQRQQEQRRRLHELILRQNASKKEIPETPTAPVLSVSEEKQASLPNPRLQEIQERDVETHTEANVPEHHGVKCDGCGELPIKGIRFKCRICPDFDLCGSCHDLKLHPHHDQFEAILRPGDSQILTTLSSGEGATCVSPTLHKDVMCDVCKIQPIIGTRYRCTTCPCFDLCGTCKNGNLHPAHHILKAYHRQASENENMSDMFDDITRLLTLSSEVANYPVHSDTKCATCSISPIRGVCFKCVQCPNYKLCHNCYEMGTNHEHEMKAIVSETQELEDELHQSMTLMKSMEEELSNYKDKCTCAICMDRMKDIAFQCGHQTCNECSQQLTECPVCRVKIRKRIRLF